MPVTVVVGGQFGSEGKGKVAQYLAEQRQATVAIRVGGPNSGHTAYDKNGRKFIFRHLPTAALLPDVNCVLGAGTYIDPDILQTEIKAALLSPDRLIIDPNANVIIAQDQEKEQEIGLGSSVGSTMTGTGAAILRRITRCASVLRAKDHPVLSRYVQPAKHILRERLSAGERIIIEGTQGHGLSLLHAPDYPFVTSRDTTAAAFISEAGLSPLDVDEIVLVLRSYPIRVSGNSGPLPFELDWNRVTLEAGSEAPLEEFTSVTQKLRRVARFDAAVVRDAILVNRPTHIVMNHLDYIDPITRNLQTNTALTEAFIEDVELGIGQSVSYCGFDPFTLVSVS